MKVKVFVIINVCVCVRILYMCVWNTSWQRQFYLTCAVTQSECVYLFFIVSSALTVPVGRSRWTTGWNTLHEPRPGLLWTFLLCMWLPWQPFKDVRCSCKINTRQMAQKRDTMQKSGIISYANTFQVHSCPRGFSLTHVDLPSDLRVLKKNLNPIQVLRNKKTDTTSRSSYADNPPNFLW